jgi:uncharacterized protein YjbI with pentapeptide repeats
LRKTLSWLRTGRRPLWAAAVIVVLIILSVVIKTIQIVNTILARTGQRNQQELEEQRARAALLQSYLEQMGELLLNHQLRSSDLSDELDNFGVVGWSGTPLVGRRISNANTEGENSRAVAQAQTLAVLEGLDPTRKRFLVQFLYYSALIKKDKPVISLGGANLRGVGLRWANLREANLSGAELNRADLGWANLMDANLSRADLSEADLRKADLSDADLSGTNLRKANLSGCAVTHGQLALCTSLAEAILPDGSKPD